MDWLEVVDEARKVTETGSGWDDALKKEATRQAGASGGLPEASAYADEIPANEATQLVVRSHIMPYKPSGRMVMEAV